VTARSVRAAAPKAKEARAVYVVAPVAGRKPARALLDVNVLIALLDADHIHHRRT